MYVSATFLKVASTATARVLTAWQLLMCFKYVHRVDDRSTSFRRSKIVASIPNSVVADVVYRNPNIVNSATPQRNLRLLHLTLTQH